MATSSNNSGSVEVLLYKWAGSWGPFKVKIPCGECSLTLDIIQDTFDNELKDIPINFEIREWLTEWWRPLPKGGWHAPIVLVDGRVVSQGNALNRGVLTEAVVNSHASKSPLVGTKLFGKETCPHCKRAKTYMTEAGVDYDYRDVVKEPLSLYEMLARVKPIVGHKTPITVPQIWMNSNYVGGADQLSQLLKTHVEPNPERGKCSMSPSR